MKAIEADRDRMTRAIVREAKALAALAIVEEALSGFEPEPATVLTYATEAVIEYRPDTDAEAKLLAGRLREKFGIAQSEKQLVGKDKMVLLTEVSLAGITLTFRVYGADVTPGCIVKEVKQEWTRYEIVCGDGVVDSLTEAPAAA